MKKLEPDWHKQQPSPDAVRTMWDKLQIKNIPITHPVLLQFVHNMKVVFPNGGALLYQFHLSENLTFDWFAYRNRLQEVEAMEKILRIHTLRTAATELMIDPSLMELPHLVFLPDGFDLQGRLARKLYFGGPTRQNGFSPEEALKLAGNFVYQLFQDRYTEVMVFYSKSAWADWFYEEGWDESYLIYDKRERHLWLLCLTDSEEG